MSAIFKRGSARVEANLTPMIDVTFLLIVFFVLVSQIVKVEHVPMELPAPVDPASERPAEERRLVINVVPGRGGTAEEYRLGSRVFPVRGEGVIAMTQHLASVFRDNPTLDINLRADRRTQYEWIEPVLRAVSEAAAASGRRGVTARVNLVVVREE